MTVDVIHKRRDMVDCARCISCGCLDDANDGVDDDDEDDNSVDSDGDDNNGNDDDE